MIHFPPCEGDLRIWRLAGHGHGPCTLCTELNPNRDVKRRSHTACVDPCAIFQSASPLTFVLHLPCTLTVCDTAPEQLNGQHRLIGSDQHHPIVHRGLRTSQSHSQHRMIYHHHARQGHGPVAHPASRSMTSPSPFDKFTVGNLSAERTFRTEKGNLL